MIKKLPLFVLIFSFQILLFAQTGDNAVTNVQTWKDSYTGAVYHKGKIYYVPKFRTKSTIDIYERDLATGATVLFYSYDPPGNENIGLNELAENMFATDDTLYFYAYIGSDRNALVPIDFISKTVDSSKIVSFNYLAGWLSDIAYINGKLTYSITTSSATYQLYWGGVSSSKYGGYGNTGNAESLLYSSSENGEPILLKHFKSSSHDCITQPNGISLAGDGLLVNLHKRLFPDNQSFFERIDMNGNVTHRKDFDEVTYSKYDNGNFVTAFGASQKVLVYDNSLTEIKNSGKIMDYLMGRLNGVYVYDDSYYITGGNDQFYIESLASQTWKSIKMDKDLFIIHENAGIEIERPIRLSYPMRNVLSFYEKDSYIRIATVDTLKVVRSTTNYQLATLNGVTVPAGPSSISYKRDISRRDKDISIVLGTEALSQHPGMDLVDGKLLSSGPHKAVVYLKNVDLESMLGNSIDPKYFTVIPATGWSVWDNYPNINMGYIEKKHNRYYVKYAMNDYPGNLTTIADDGSMENKNFLNIELINTIFVDTDGDGVADSIDECPNTPTGQTVNAQGCSSLQLDNDGDGVLNTLDQCPTTPTGATVNATGCLVIPANNFTISAISETCPSKNNGKIIITALKTLAYTATINQNPYTFSNTSTLSNLKPGTYSVCITIANDNYEQCYTLEIAAGTTVSGKSFENAGKMAISIAQGTAPFEVSVNNKLVFKSASSEFSVDVTKGDMVSVKTSVSCEGIYQKTASSITSIVAYPNPTQGNVEIQLNTTQKNVEVQVYSIQGQLILNTMAEVKNNSIKLNLTDKPSGVYIAKVMLKEPAVVKIIKN